jgi:hypothetical protein
MTLRAITARVTERFFRGKSVIEAALCKRRFRCFGDGGAASTSRNARPRFTFFLLQPVDELF